MLMETKIKRQSERGKEYNFRKVFDQNWENSPTVFQSLKFSAKFTVTIKLYP